MPFGSHLRAPKNFSSLVKCGVDQGEDKLLALR